MSIKPLQMSTSFGRTMAIASNLKPNSKKEKVESEIICLVSDDEEKEVNDDKVDVGDTIGVSNNVACLSEGAVTVLANNQQKIMDNSLTCMDDNDDDEDDVFIIYDGIPQRYSVDSLPDDFFDRETPPNTPRRLAQKQQNSVDPRPKCLDFSEDNEFQLNPKIKKLQEQLQKFDEELLARFKKSSMEKRLTDNLCADKYRTNEVNRIGMQCESIRDKSQEKENMPSTHIHSPSDAKMKGNQPPHNSDVIRSGNVWNNEKLRAEKSVKRVTSLNGLCCDSSEALNRKKKQKLPQNIIIHGSSNKDVSKLCKTQKLPLAQRINGCDKKIYHHKQEDTATTYSENSFSNKGYNPSVNCSQKVERRNRKPETSKRVKMKRCEFCGKLVPNLTDHILNDHQSLFTC